MYVKHFNDISVENKDELAKHPYIFLKMWIPRQISVRRF